MNQFHLEFVGNHRTIVFGELAGKTGASYLDVIIRHKERYGYC